MYKACFSIQQRSSKTRGTPIEHDALPTRDDEATSYIDHSILNMQRQLPDDFLTFNYTVNNNNNNNNNNNKNNKNNNTIPWFI
uniref:AlNc14C365G11049 protein n=1 Tax=Albugo laibachii Nc14 TaxID=890382 RepID=F0WXW2_9STRA|nr:AlNc14C365G11049 [Albugo laibachii Nc14]|eukprot:CCA26310.1 AlNc14C365G11049 [Albugo laibachii Nc14]